MNYLKGANPVVCGAGHFFGIYPAVHKDQFTVFINLALNFYHQTSIVEQSAVQIYIKQAMTTSKLHYLFGISFILV